MLRFDASGLVSALSRFRGELKRNFKAATQSAASESRWFVQSGAYWTNRTGKTSRSFTVTGIEDGHRMSSRNKVAGFIENGTRAHIIAARPGKTLSFIQNGQRRFAKSVRHPGTKAKRYATKEATRMAPVLVRKTGDAIEAAAVSAGLL